MIALDIIKTEAEFHELCKLWNKGYQYSIFSDYKWISNYWKFLKTADDELAVFVFREKNDSWIIFPFKSIKNSKTLEFICSSKTDYNYVIENIQELSREEHTSAYKEAFKYLLVSSFGSKPLAFRRTF